MFGSLVVSILPTSQVIILVTGSNEYFPWVGVSVTFSTDFGNGISRITFSTWKIWTAYIFGVHVFGQLNTTFECNNHCTLGFTKSHRNPLTYTIYQFSHRLLGSYSYVQSTRRPFLVWNIVTQVNWNSDHAESVRNNRYTWQNVFKGNFWSLNTWEI